LHLIQFSLGDTKYISRAQKRNTKSIFQSFDFRWHASDMFN